MSAVLIPSLDANQEWKHFASTRIVLRMLDTELWYVVHINCLRMHCGMYLRVELQI